MLIRLFLGNYFHDFSRLTILNDCNQHSSTHRVVTHNSLKKNVKVLEAYSEIANKTIKKSKNYDIPNRIKLASTQLCFEQLCINWRTTTKKEFLQEYVYHLNNYLVEHESNISMLIDTESGE